MEDFQHPECYARALGGCSDQVNKEHYVSQSILELIDRGSEETSKSVRAFGLSFLGAGEPRHLGVASLAAKILCTTHNGMLSPYDAVGKAMFVAMEGLNTAAGDPAAAQQVFKVNGDKLERWLLKVLFGGLYSGAFVPPSIGTMKGECPPDELLAILFRGVAFPARQGLYWIPPKAGERITPDEKILQVGFLEEANTGVGGLFVQLFGFTFALLTACILSGESTMFDVALYRPAGLRAIGSNARIEFSWQGGPHSQEIEMQYHSL